VEWVLDRHRREGEPVCVVQARPVTAALAGPATPAEWDPAAMAAKYVFGTWRLRRGRHLAARHRAR
jgi:pyruvate,water dikinase